VNSGFAMIQQIAATIWQGLALQSVAEHLSTNPDQRGLLENPHVVTLCRCKRDLSVCLPQCDRQRVQHFERSFRHCSKVRQA